ncbi:hypothetical protein AB4084_28015, partial [Lysobacter sp. 2RAB21]
MKSEAGESAYPPSPVMSCPDRNRTHADSWIYFARHCRESGLLVWEGALAPMPFGQVYRVGA